MDLMKNDDSPYNIGTDEAAVKLGLTTRSVRRLARQRVLDGHLETTSLGRQWFFSEVSIKSLIEAREEKRRKEKRHQATQETLGRTTSDMSEDSPGQPRTTKGMSKVVRPKVSFAASSGLLFRSRDGL